MVAGHMGQVVGYVRVSAADQNEARKLESLGAVDRLFSGKWPADPENHNAEVVDE